MTKKGLMGLLLPEGQESIMVDKGQAWKLEQDSEGSHLEWQGGRREPTRDD